MSGSLAEDNKRITVEEYLELEAKSKVKHEFFDGEIIAMAGAKRSHSLAAGNIFRQIANQLVEKDCEVHQSDIKVKVRDNHFVYPDVVAACGELDWESGETVLLNPTVVFEVLSKSTEARDRGEKAQDYRRLPTLTDYLLVSQKEMLIEHFSRQNDGSWKLVEYRTADDVIRIESIGCAFTLENAYHGITFPKLKLVKTENKDAI